MFIPFSKEQNAQSPSIPLPVRSRDIRNRAAASKLARLIDPAVTLTRDWLICQPAKAHFSAEPNSHFIGCLRNPIHSSGAQNTRHPRSRQPPFLRFFCFFSKGLSLLGIFDVFSAGFSMKTAGPPAKNPVRPVFFNGARAPRLRFQCGGVCSFSHRKHAGFRDSGKATTWVLY